MRWRLRKLDWGYALGELIIVTAGVLIALAIDEWNSDRLNRVDEISTRSWKEKARRRMTRLDTLPIGAVVAEIDFSRFVEATLAEADEWRQGLLEQLEAYKSAIQ